MTTMARVLLENVGALDTDGLVEHALGPTWSVQLPAGREQLRHGEYGELRRNDNRLMWVMSRCCFLAGTAEKWSHFIAFPGKHRDLIDDATAVAFSLRNTYLIWLGPPFEPAMNLACEGKNAVEVVEELSADFGPPSEWPSTANPNWMRQRL